MAAEAITDVFKVEQMSPWSVAIRQKMFQALDIDMESDPLFVKKIIFHVGNCNWLAIVSCIRRPGHFQLHCALFCPSYLERALDVKYKVLLHRPSIPLIEKTGNHQFKEAARCLKLQVVQVESLDDLFGDCLTLDLLMWVKEPELDAKSKFKLVRQSESTSAQVKALGSLLDSQLGSDVGFFFVEDCSGFKAHRAILSSRSSVFQQLLSDGSQDIIVIKEIGSVAFKILLRHVYTGLLALPDEIDEDICKKVVVAAEKYGFVDFKNFAALALVDFATKENCLRLLEFVINHEAEEAKEKVLTFVNEYPEPIFHLLSFKAITNLSY